MAHRYIEKCGKRIAFVAVCAKEHDPMEGEGEREILRVFLFLNSTQQIVHCTPSSSSSSFGCDLLGNGMQTHGGCEHCRQRSPEISFSGKVNNIKQFNFFYCLDK